MSKNSSAKYYQKAPKVMLRKKARERYQDLPEKEINKNRQYGHER